ncbi:Thioredoxin domain-containing protein [Plasmodiophora brassicae]
MVPSAIVAVVTALAAGRILAGPIVDITKDNYEEHMRSGDWLLKFYSPYCHVCVSTQPIWEKAVAQITDASMKFGAVDCTKETELAKLYKIGVYPTIIRLSGGQAFSFDGDPRVDQAIVDFANANWKSKQPLGNAPRIGGDALQTPPDGSSAPVFLIVIFALASMATLVAFAVRLLPRKTAALLD